MIISNERHLNNEIPTVDFCLNSAYDKMSRLSLLSFQYENSKKGATAAATPIHQMAIVHDVFTSEKCSNFSIKMEFNLKSVYGTNRWMCCVEKGYCIKEK